MITEREARRRQREAFIAGADAQHKAEHDPILATGEDRVRSALQTMELAYPSLDEEVTTLRHRGLTLTFCDDGLHIRRDNNTTEIGFVPL